MIAVLLSALTISVAPVSVPDPPDPYGWVCDYLDAAPTLFGVMGLAGEVADRGLDPETAQRSITVVVRNDCPEHVPLLNSLSLVVGG
jgi:hypothetical protein